MISSNWFTCVLGISKQFTKTNKKFNNQPDYVMYSKQVGGDNLSIVETTQICMCNSMSVYFRPEKSKHRSPAKLQARLVGEEKGSSTEETNCSLMCWSLLTC